MPTTDEQPQPPKRGRGRPPKDPRLVASGAERQERLRNRQQRAMGQALALIAALDRMVTPEQRAKLETLPPFAELLNTARLTMTVMAGR